MPFVFPFLRYTFIERRATIRVRPLSHTEHPRFLLAAAPYYTAQVAMVIMLFLFCAVFLSVDKQGSQGTHSIPSDRLDQAPRPKEAVLSQNARASSASPSASADASVAAPNSA